MRRFPLFISLLVLLFGLTAAQAGIVVEEGHDIINSDTITDGVMVDGGMFMNNGMIRGGAIVNGGTLMNSSSGILSGGITVNDGILMNANHIYGGATVNGGTLKNDNKIWEGAKVNGGMLEGSGTIHRASLNKYAVEIGKDGKFDTSLYTGKIEGIRFEDGGELLFTVESLVKYSTLKSFGSGSVNLSGAKITVYFDREYFAGDDWDSFELKDLFNFTEGGGFSFTDWWTPWGGQFTITGLEEGAYYVEDATVFRKEKDLSAPTPEPATMLLLGLGAMAGIPLARRFRKR